MEIEEKMFAALAGDGGVTSLVPVARILPDGVYQGIARPFLKHFAVALSPIETHAGPANLERWGYQVSMFADSIADLAELRSAVQACFAGLTDPRVAITGLERLESSQSTDAPIVGQALTLEVW